MKVLHWLDYFWPLVGGIENLTLQVLPRQRSLGIDAAVITSLPRQHLAAFEILDGTPVYRLPMLQALTGRQPAEILGAIRRVAELKQTLQPDLIHLHLGGVTALFHLRTLAAFPAPTLVTVHNSVLAYRSHADAVVDRVLRQADRIIAVSHAMLADTLQVMPDIAARAMVMHSGIQAPDLEPAPLPFAPPVLLCLGRLVRDKGFDLAIDALPHVLAAHPQTRLLIAGEGEARPALQAQALGIEAQVRFLGQVEPAVVPALLNQATLMLTPSRCREAMAHVTLEAAWMARPVIAADRGGLPEAVLHGQTGLIVPPEDSAALAEATIGLLDSPQTARRLGAAARLHVQEHHDLDRYVNRLVQVYESMV